jgi:small-conductance mechanosensitive channel/CRP-like cAMP-binding protein
VNILSLSPNTALLWASALLFAVAIGSWARPRRPLWVTIVVHIGTFAVLTWLVKTGLGSPLRPQFETERSGVMLWQQCVEIGWWIIGARAVAAGIRALVALEGRPHESRIVSDLMAAGIYIATALAITNFAFSVPVGGLLATSGVIAIVLGLALQSTLSDVFSGIAVGLERAYKPGDLLWVEGDIEGTVVQVSWRSTQIRTRHNNIAIIPNSVIAKSRLINRSSPTPSRADNMLVKLDAHADPARCLAILGAAVQTCLLPLARPEPRVAYAGLNGDGSTFEISYSVASSDDLVAARTELLSQVHRHLLHAGISLAIGGNPHPPPVPTSTIATLIERSDLFGVLPPAERKVLAKHFVPIALEKGDILIRQGEMPSSVFLIASGVVEVTRKESGIPRTLARLGPGDGIGLVGLFTDQPHPATGTALTGVDAYHLDKSALATALNVCPNMAGGLKALAERRERVLLQGIAMHANDEQEHAQAFLRRIRQALHRLAA